MNLYRRKLNKIYDKIVKIATRGGKSNFIEFRRYVNELLNKGQYTMFTECLLLFYNIDISREQDVFTNLEKTWKIIYTNSISSLQNAMKRFHRVNKIYHNGLYLYDELTNLKIGKIEETSVPLNTLSYYYKNDNYSKLINELITILIATKLNYKFDNKYYSIKRIESDEDIISDEYIYILNDKLLLKNNFDNIEIDKSKLIIEEYHNPATSISNIELLFQDFMRNDDKDINKTITDLSNDMVRLYNIYDPEKTHNDNLILNYTEAIIFFLNIND